MQLQLLDGDVVGVERANDLRQLGVAAGQPNRRPFRGGGLCFSRTLLEPAAR